MLPIATGISVLNAMSCKDIPDCDKDELTLCREAAARGEAKVRMAALVPGFLQRLLRRRAMRIELDKAVQRLAETSPHLLRDIGIIGGIDMDDETPEGAKVSVEVAKPAPKVPAARPVVQVTPFARPAIGQGAAHA